MSLRTRRSLTFMASLTFLAVACTGGTTPTAAPPASSNPATTTPATSAPGSTAPESTAPGSTAPESMAPESTAPESTAPESQAPGTGGTLRLYCCATDPRSLQPQAASGTDEISVIGGIQRGLLYYNQDLSLRPELATDMPTVSDDGLTYTFTLGDHNYSNGQPIVAADYVRAARSLADPRNAFDYGYEACWIAGVDAVLGSDFGCSTDERAPYTDVDACDLDPTTCAFDTATVDGLLDQIGVTAPDEHTVVFTLKTPTSFFTNLLAMWLFTPVPETQTSWAEAADIISSGPFMISAWQHQAEIDLVPNPEWNGTAPGLDKIELHIGGDPAAAVAAWERGDLDMVAVPSSDTRRVLDTPDYADKINRSTTLSVEYYDFANCPDADTCPTNAAVTAGDVPGGGPTQNNHFRRAMTAAIDKHELIEIGFAGLGEVAYSPTMPGIPGFPTVTDENNPLAFDTTLAASEMQTALDELGIPQPDPATVLATDCPPLFEVAEGTTPGDHPECVGRARVKLLAPMRFGYNCDAGHDQRVLYIAQKWRENLGFSGTQMDIRCTDFGTFRTERRAGNVYDIARNGWGADFPHPDNQNRDLFACGAGNNNSKYCNPDYDALLNQGAGAADYDTAVPFYQDAENLLVEDSPVLFLRYGEGVRLIYPWVQGITQTTSDHTNVGDVFYETMTIAAH